MVWCSHCQEDCVTVKSDDYICCEGCGKVLYEANFYDDFEITIDRKTQPSRYIMKVDESEDSSSSERASMKALREKYNVPTSRNMRRSAKRRRSGNYKRKDLMQEFITSMKDGTNLDIDAMGKGRPPPPDDEYSIKKCILFFNEMHGFTLEEMVKATMVFKNKENREVFMSLKEDQRDFWLRAMFCMH